MGAFNSSLGETLTRRLTFASIPDENDATQGAQGIPLPIRGLELGVNPQTPDTIQLLVSFGEPGNWTPMVACSVLESLKMFERVWLKRVAGSDADPLKTLILEYATRPGSIRYPQKPQALSSSIVTPPTFTPVKKNVTNVATLLVAANLSRKTVIIVNEDPANDVHVGRVNTITTVANSMRVFAGGGSLALDTTDTLYAIAAVAGPSVVSVAEIQ